MPTANLRMKWVAGRGMINRIRRYFLSLKPMGGLSFLHHSHVFDNIRQVIDFTVPIRRTLQGAVFSRIFFVCWSPPNICLCVQ